MTNVVRAFEIAAKSERQLVYYDPGVGTMGARSATTRLGKTLTQVWGLVLGHGVKENLEEAYTFLMRSYEPDDHVFVFGFSRGAYTALALTGMLRTVGLLRPGAENLVPYAVKLYTQSGKPGHTDEDEKRFWRKRDAFNETFGNPEFPNPFGRQVHFLGIWDAVKTVGWFNWRAQFEEARWPFTRKVPNVRFGRHALALDEKRRPYAEYRLQRDDEAKRRGNVREMWFAGVHSDVGGVFEDDHRLSDIALYWIVEGAREAGLMVDPKGYNKHLGVDPDDPLPEENSRGKIHANQLGWAILGLGWHRRIVGHDDEIHPSVHARIRATAADRFPYRPRFPNLSN